MIVKNYKELAINKHRQQMLQILDAGIIAVEPRHMLSKLVRYNEDFNSVKIFNRSYDMMSGRIFIVGAGKAAGAMTEALENIIYSDRLSGGVVVIRDSSFRYKTPRVKLIKASHPLPDNKSIKASKKLFELKDKYGINERDLVICVISGGASSLLAMPVNGVNLTDKQETTRRLLASGATISEINVVRKHLSKIKGGQMAEHFSPAQVVTLIISDVVGDDLTVIGSGPTVADTSTFKEALAIIYKYSIENKVPKSAMKYLEKGANNDVPETPKKLFNADNYVVGNNNSSLEAMAHKAISLGLRPVIVSDELKGDPNVTAYKIVRHVLQDKFKKYNVLLYAGETNPKLPEKYGRGGRNQQFAAATMLAFRNLKMNWAMLSASSDGIDFDLKVAGAIVDNDTVRLAEEKKMHLAPFVRTYDTYSMFKKIGSSLIETGATGTNVADLAIYMLDY